MFVSSIYTHISVCRTSLSNDTLVENIGIQMIVCKSLVYIQTYLYVFLTKKKHF